MGYYSKRVPSGKIVDKNYIQGLSNRNTFEYGQTQVTKGVDKIREDIMNLFSVRKREHFFEPDLGSNLDMYLFETNDFLLADLVSKCVTEDIENYLDNVKVSEVYIEQLPNEGTLKIHVVYDIISLGVKDDITLFKEVKEQIKL